MPDQNQEMQRMVGPRTRRLRKIPNARVIFPHVLGSPTRLEVIREVDAIDRPPETVVASGDHI